MTTVENQVYSDANLEIVRERVAKLNKRAVAKGFPCCIMTHELSFIGHEMHDGSIIKNPNEYQLKKKCTGRVVPVYDVKIEFPKMVIGEWELIGALRPLQLENGTWENLLNSVPGKEIPTHFSHTVSVCEHCKHKRRRSETFVVKNDKGEYKSIGRNCIRDFLGHDPSRLLWVYDQITSISEDWEGFGPGAKYNPDYDLLSVLAKTFKCIAVDGWVSSKMASEKEMDATSSDVSRILGDWKPFSWSDTKWEEYKNERAASDEEFDRAHQAIEWARSLSTDSGYARNVNLVTRVGRVTSKEMGLACSIAASFLRATTDELLRKQKAVEIDEYFGSVGTRVEIEVTVVRVIPVDTMYGQSGLHIMRTPQGHCLKWFSSSSEWLEEGEQCKVKATIKDHDVYQDKKQTSLSRVKLVKEKASA